MSPRVQPKPVRVSPELSASQKANREHDEAMSYGGDSPHSFFRDLADRDAADQRRRDSALNPVLRGSDPGDSSRFTLPENLELARLRLRRAERTASEKFDLSTSTGLVPSNQLPAELRAEFEIAARGRGTVAAALGVNPIPEATGTTVGIARMTSGSTVTIVSSEGDPNSETDPAFAFQSATLAYATGQVDVSQQVLDRAGKGTAYAIDTMIARDLGAAAAEKLDSQILNGAGTSGETKGILNWSGITATTYTDASPTISEFVSKLGSSYSSTAVADGRGPDTLILHPRRLAWLNSQTIGSGEDQPQRILSLYDRVVEAPCMPTTLGSGTDQDRVISLRSGAVKIYSDSTITAHRDPLSSTLTTRFVVTMRVAVVCPAPTGVGVLSGTGLAAPTFA